MSAARVLLVGWDGADGDIVRPLIETGALPRLRGIVEAGVMVSEGFPGLGATGDALPAGAVQPAHLAAALAEMRVQPAELDAGALREFVPDLGRDGAGPDAGDPRLAALRLILADAVSVHAAATWLMQNEAWSLFAVRYRALGAFSHGYMRDRAPAEGGDARYGGVVEAAYRFHDMMLGAPLAGDIEGRVLAEAFYAPPPAPAARPSAAGARTPEERGAGAAPPDAVPADPAPADPADERQLALARVHLDAGRAAAALPGDPRSALLLHGAVLIERGRVDEGLARLAQAERIELLSAALLTEIGRLYLCCGRPAEAARALARAVASGAGSGAAQEMLAESLLALGLVARAADAALGAVRLRHDSQRAHALFAETLARLGDHERAAAHRAIARELAGRAPLNRAPA